MLKEKKIIEKYYSEGLLTKDDALRSFKELKILRSKNNRISVYDFLVENQFLLDGSINYELDENKISEKIIKEDSTIKRESNFSSEFNDKNEFVRSSKINKKQLIISLLMILLLLMCFFIFKSTNIRKNNENTTSSGTPTRNEASPKREIPARSEILARSKMPVFQHNEHKKQWVFHEPHSYNFEFLRITPDDKYEIFVLVIFKNKLEQNVKIDMYFQMVEDKSVSVNGTFLIEGNVADGVIALPSTFFNVGESGVAKTGLIEFKLNSSVSGKFGYGEYNDSNTYTVNVPVLEKDRFVLIKPIPVKHSVDDFVLSEDNQFIYMWSEESGKVSVFNIAQDKIEQIKLISNPKSILARGDLIYVSNFSLGTISIFNIKNNLELIKIIQIDNKYPGHISAPVGEYFKGVIYVTAGKVTPNDFYKIDTISGTTLKTNSEKQMGVLCVDYKEEYGYFFNPNEDTHNLNLNYCNLTELFANNVFSLTDSEIFDKKFAFVRQLDNTYFWFSRCCRIYSGNPIKKVIYSGESFVVPVLGSNYFLEFNDVLSIKKIDSQIELINSINYQDINSREGFLDHSCPNCQYNLMNNFAIPTKDSIKFFFGNTMEKKVFRGTISNQFLKD